jgi:hypothetical protein
MKFVGFVASALSLWWGLPAIARATLSPSPLGRAVLAAHRPGNPAAATAELKPIRISSSGGLDTLTIKRKMATVYALTAGSSMTVEAEGPGQLRLEAYAVLALTTPAAGILVVAIDGSPLSRTALSVRTLPQANVATSARARVTNPATVGVHLSPGHHVVTVSSSPDAALAVLRIVYIAEGQKTEAPIIFAPPAAPAFAIAPESGSSPTSPSREVVPPRWAAVVAKIKSGAARDSLNASYPAVDMVETGAEAGSARHFPRVRGSQAFEFVVDGPGTVDVRLHLLRAADEHLPETIKLTLFENDVLLQSFDVVTTASPRFTVTGDPALAVGERHEYRLTLEQKLCRFSLQVADIAKQGIAIQYEFVPGAKSKESSLAEDIGGDLGIGGTDAAGPTAVMEVAETVRVVKVGEATEILGL